jgi:hypothetical protein
VELEMDGEGWRRMEKIIWTECVKNAEVLQRVKEETNVLNKRRKANWIGHILRRNCPLKHAIEGKIERKIEVTERPGRRRRQLLWIALKKREERGSTVWRVLFREGYGFVVGQTA